MKKYLVSFCISSYRRASLTIELINELLELREDNFEIVICDDYSKDGTIEQIKSIPKWGDERLRIVENPRNYGGLRNIYRTLACGEGEFLFYINDRDQVDSFKVPLLLEILLELRQKNVAFIRCARGWHYEKYQIFELGKEAFLEFACRIVHPTGYIFRKDALDEIAEAEKYYANEYGDYGHTLHCALLSKKYNGAIIWGDMCDVYRRRLDFSIIRSFFHKDEKDFPMWYSVDVQYRELRISYYFLKENGFDLKWVEELLFKRYKEYLETVMTNYGIRVKDPVNTLHYGLPFINDDEEIIQKALQNGIELKQRVMEFCRDIGMESLENTIKIYTDAEIEKFILQNFLD